MDICQQPASATQDVPAAQNVSAAQDDAAENDKEHDHEDHSDSDQAPRVPFTKGFVALRRKVLVKDT